jgi:hypothetical protein
VLFNTRFIVWVLLFIEDTTVTVKCRAAIKALFLYFNVCPSTMLDSRSMFIYIHILSYYKLCLYFKLCLSVMLDSSSMFIYIHILSYSFLLHYIIYISSLIFGNIVLTMVIAWLIYWFIDWWLAPTLAV